MGDEPAAAREVTAPSTHRPVLVRTNLGLLAAAVFALGIGVLAFATAGGRDSGAELTTADRESDAVAVPSPDEESDDRIEVAVEAGEQTLRFELPPGWVDNAPGAGVSGDARFPSDPELARVFDEYVQVATEQGAVLFALDTDLTGQSSARVFYNPPQPDVTFATSVQAGRQVLEDTAGVDLTVDEPIALNGGTGHLFRYTTEVDGAPLHNVQIAIPANQGSYVLVGQSYDSAQIDELVGLASSISIT